MKPYTHVLEGASLPAILLHSRVKWHLMCFLEMWQYLHNENVPFITISTVFNIWKVSTIQK